MASEPKENLSKLVAGLFEISPGNFVHRWLRMNADGAASVVDNANMPSDSIVGNIATPAASTVANLITTNASDGFTTLVLRLTKLQGYASTDFPGFYYVINSPDPALSLSDTTKCPYLSIGEEAVILLKETDPLTSVDIYPVGTVANTLIEWEYK